MALVTVTNLSGKDLSCDVGLVPAGGSKSLDMGPDAAYRASEGLKGLVDAGLCSVVVAAETRLLDSLEPAQVSTASVADLAVTTAKLAADAVTTAKINNLAVTTAKLNDLAVTNGKIALLAVDSGQLAAGAVTAGKIATGGVSATAQLAAGIVTAAKMPIFCSTEQTGTGSSQDVAHGLSGTPSIVLAIVTDDNSGTFVCTYGTHDGTNCKVTVATGCKFKILALL